MWGKLPNTLCHYTSQDGFTGIITNLSIWATSILYFEKDLTEFSYSIDFTINSMNMLRKEYLRYDQPFLLEFKRQLNWIKAHLASHELNIFICSFSRLENQLSQWNEHCPHGNGYCICFDPQKLYSVASRYGAKLEPCLYDEDEQLRKIREAIREGVNGYFHSELKAAPSKNQDVQTSARIAAEYFILIFMTKIAPFLKNREFKVQQEWRLSLSPEVYGPGPSILPKGLRVRKGNDLVEKRYVEISLIGDWGSYGHFPFSKVYVGPGTNEDGATKYAQELLQKQGIDDCEVERWNSSLPFASTQSQLYTS